MQRASEHRRVNHGLQDGISQSTQCWIRGSNKNKGDVGVRQELTAGEWRDVSQEVCEELERDAEVHATEQATGLAR
jgi:hypothetical protein